MHSKKDHINCADSKLRLVPAYLINGQKVARLITN